MSTTEPTHSEPTKAQIQHLRQFCTAKGDVRGAALCHVALAPGHAEDQARAREALADRLHACRRDDLLAAGYLAEKGPLPALHVKSSMVADALRALWHVDIIEGDDGYLIVTCQDVSGCISQGRDVADATRNIVEALDVSVG